MAHNNTPGGSTELAEVFQPEYSITGFQPVPSPSLSSTPQKHIYRINLDLPLILYIILGFNNMYFLLIGKAFFNFLYSSKEAFFE